MKKRVGFICGHDDQRAGLSGCQAAVMKGDACVGGRFAMQRREKLRRLGSSRLQSAKRRTIAVHPIGIAQAYIQRFVYVGYTLPPFDDEGSDRSETVSAGSTYGIGRNTNSRADRLIQRVEPPPDVHHVTLCAEFELGASPNIADHRGAGVHADAGFTKLDATSLLSALKRRAKLSIASAALTARSA
jgi:hypothetical protein